MTNEMQADSFNIVAKVYFNGGVHGFEEPYQASRRTNDYVKYFEEKSNQSNLTESSKLLSIEITLHNEDGTYQRDARGNRVMQLLYFDKEFGKRLFPGLR